MKIIFEKMTDQHCAAVMSIFNYYALNSFSAYPDTELSDTFFFKILEVTENYPAFVIKNEKDDHILGFCFLRAYNPFSVFKKTAEISYFIKNGYTGNGLGKMALDKLETEAKKIGLKYILASITSKNPQSISFHKKNGFEECGNFKDIGEKKGQPFSIIWMRKELV